MKKLPINEEKQGKGDVVSKCGCGCKKMFALLSALFYYTPISNPSIVFLLSFLLPDLFLKKFPVAV